MATTSPIRSTTKRNWWLPGSNSLLGCSVVLSALHHVDHVLRVDHSGWPFIPQVTPFTFSLLIYPIFLLAYLQPKGSWSRVWLFGTIYLAVQMAHIVVEPPYAQFHTWAVGSFYPWAAHTPTLFLQHSTVMGILSVTLSLLVSIAMILTFISLLRDALLAREARRSQRGVQA